MKKLNPSIKHHTLIATFLGGWIFLFAFIIRPFEHGEMDLQKWISVSIGFSVIPFLSYLIISLLQNLVYKRMERWNVSLEVSFYVLFFSLYTIGTYAYYLSPIIDGFYSFSEFFMNITIKIVLVLTPVIYVARRYSLKLIPKKEAFILIRGDNKLDFLKIKQDDLVCVSNAQNYVEIFYVENNELKTKLIRTSLKKLQGEFDFLMQVHRSHLINPPHFKSWKDSNTIVLTQKELPVSKSYKNQLSNL